MAAQEVRHLAQRSANASKDIKALIGASNSHVRNGVDLVNQTGAALGEIVGAVKKVSDIVGEIALASQEQTTGLEQVSQAVGHMDELTQRNSGLVEETTASAQLLADQAGALTGVIGYFRMGAARGAGQDMTGRKQRQSGVRPKPSSCGTIRR